VRIAARLSPPALNCHRDQNCHQRVTHDIEVGADNQRLGITQHSSDIPAQHLNKYGQEYSPEKPKSY
jgi:hypothetical protein